MNTEADRFRLIDEAFRRAIAADAADRDRVLTEASGGDESVIDEVRSLLDADAIDNTLTLGQPTATDAAPAQAGPAWGDLPATIGGYELETPIGRGGMGVVYRARRVSPARTVALKIIRRALTSETTLRRFRLEAEALARMQHPGIAALYEIGLDEGIDQPFFAMELVEGESITAHAESRNLSVNERLGLLARVCDAIDHAHTRGVIHRDLKPENVFVTADGQPKVLDLGIAKLLDHDNDSVTSVTEAGQIVGTLGYMSPEQVSGDPHAIDPRCDVYALGVLGYELLAGRRPIETTGMGMYEAIHHIKNTPPEPLAAARPELDQDIVTIISKAIAKDAAGRYESAARLADDIRRFLADEPITARPPSTLYQLSKFAKRNRTLVGSVAAIFVVLVVSLAAVGLSLRATRVSQRQAEADREVTQAVNAFLLEDLIAAADPRQGGDQSVTLIDALNGASENLGDRFAAAPRSEAAIRAALGEIYSTLNDFPRATENTRRALDLTPGGDPALRFDRLNALAVLHMDLDEFDEAATALDEADRLLTGDRSDQWTRRRLEARGNRGRLLYKTGDSEAALAEYRFVHDEGKRRLPPGDDLTLAAGGAVSLIYQQLGRLDEAQAMSEEAVRLYEDLYGPEHPDTLTTLTNHAMLLTRLERYGEAESTFRRVLDARLRTMGDDNVDTNVTRFVYAGMLLKAGRPAEAAELARLACDTLNAVLGPEHRYTSRACTTADQADAAAHSAP